jgi:opacity protein-like surface antigen
MRLAHLRRIIRTKEVDMKKLVLVITLVLGIVGPSAFAADYRDDNRIAYSSDRRGGALEYQINRMNRMLSHVQGEVRRYGAGWRFRRELASISRDVDRINWRYRHNQFDRYRLRREVDSIRQRLRSIEVRLHGRSGDFFRWD